MTTVPMLMSGHCSFPQTAHPERSHERCTLPGCPCCCHLGEEFECAGCGGVIREAPLWPLDEDGDIRYTHVDPRDGRAIGEEC